jgi:hypothetical protein
MKLSAPGGNLNPATARNAALINQFATPGLGSLLARRWVAGAGQLFLALAGFVLMLVWFTKTMLDYYSLMFDQHGEPQPHSHWLKLGVLFFAAAWLWSLVTSLELIRAAKTSPPEIQNQPPILPR